MSDSSETGVYHCDIHDLEFEKRDWCPQCEIEFEVMSDE